MEVSKASYRRVELQKIQDHRGTLCIGEFEKDIPFSVSRFFAIYDVPEGESRGQHAHRECHQFLVCIRGSCRLAVEDAAGKDEFVLDDPTVGYHLPPMVWGTQYHYSADALLLVFASHFYEAADYIRDYAEFVQFLGASRDSVS